MKPHLAILATLSSALFAAEPTLEDVVAQRLGMEYTALDALYKHFHANPELSLQEEKTAARLAAELRAAGFDVTERFGGYGVVAVLQNGGGPTVLIRADMDALPVEEQTGLPYASKVRMTDDTGREVPVMHACGHDIHLTCLVGTGRILAALRERWSGTLVLIGQPAEELGVGAQQMLAAGLCEQFPKPDIALALHNDEQLPAGSIGLLEGYLYLWIGAVNPVAFAEHQRTGARLEPLHSARYAPEPEPTIKTGVTAMTAAALELLGKHQPVATQ
jgi:metal-dependent amidase/aminoacylase/carboxypeptidase family protein